jgi:arylsulfatase A-like enzyme
MRKAGNRARELMLTSLTASFLFWFAGFPCVSQAMAAPHNIIIFVADGLRYGSVEPGNMPNMARVKAEGVDFTNSHSLFPTVTTANASVIATGHYVGDTGNFGNAFYVGQPMDSMKGSPIAYLATNAVLEELNHKFGGNYLGEESLIAAARAAGWQTAIIGEQSPVRIQDLTAPPEQNLILDDASGHEGGYALPDWFKTVMAQTLGSEATPKGDVPNTAQEQWLTKAATQIVLPHFKSGDKPFVLFYWAHEPDLSQHLARDSIGQVQPGINGATAKVGAHSADSALGELLTSLRALGLAQTTDVFVTADHGFSTVSHDDNGRTLAYGMVASDLAKALNLPMTQPGFLGNDPAKPDVVVVSGNGGNDLIYLPGGGARTGEIVGDLASESYVSGIFVNDRLGKFPSALALSDVGLMGAAQTPQPSIVISFRSYSACGTDLQCGIEVGDTPYQTGQGSHGSLNRAETRNFMTAIGPDFKRAYADAAPVSNADIAPTLARIMGLRLPTKGALQGRVIGEALPKGSPVTAVRKVIASDPGPTGIRTYLDEQMVGTTRYFDAAGFEGRTLGLAVR